MPKAPTSLKPPSKASHPLVPMANPVTTTLDSTANPTTTTSSSITTTITTNKRRKIVEEPDDGQDDHISLLPGLPDHVAQHCLSHVHPTILYSVCRAWRRVIYNQYFPPFLSIYALFLSNQAHTHVTNPLRFLSFDPISSKWHSIHPKPPDLPLRLIRHHPSFISRNLPIQSITVSGNQLVLLAATADHLVPALPRPLIFNPIHKKWSLGPPLAAPRRWCAAGSAGGAVYVASGVGSQYSSEVARSVEKWNLSNTHMLKSRDRWEKLSYLRDQKLSREAIDAVGWRGKLCMVNVKGDAAKEGVVYEIEKDLWEHMPEGMLAGWRGPAAAMAEEIVYVVDESKGLLKKYEPEKDRWVEIIESEKLRGAEHMAAAGGRVCVVCGGGNEIVVVDVVAAEPRLWVVESPAGFQAVAIHILPRMSREEEL